MGLGIMVNERIRIPVELGGLNVARLRVQVDPFEAMVSKCFH